MATVAQANPDVARETQETCSRCEKPLDTNGYPLWCKACQNAYRKEYRSLQKQMSEGRGFCAGVAAAKDFLANEFHHNIRGAMISGHEAARLVRACKGPALPTT